MLEQFDVVKIISIHKENIVSGSAQNMRRPKIGDLATIIEIYQDPKGYELECVDNDGNTIWISAFSLTEIELELVKKQ